MYGNIEEPGPFLPERKINMERVIMSVFVYLCMCVSHSERGKGKRYVHTVGERAQKALQPNGHAMCTQLQLIAKNKQR